MYALNKILTRHYFNMLANFLLALNHFIKNHWNVLNLMTMLFIFILMLIYCQFVILFNKPFL
jgi:hypothetical protein